MPGHSSKRKPEYIKRLEVRGDAGKGDLMRPTSAAFAENFDAAFGTEGRGEAEESGGRGEYGALGVFAREKVRGSDGVLGPRYMVDPGSLLEEIDRVEKEAR